MVFRFADLPLPIIQAPMAGGPSTPELAAAVSQAGGLGSLAAGYTSAEAMAGDITATRSLTARSIAVNLFVPEAHASDPHDVEAYAHALTPLARELDVPPIAIPTAGDDEYPQKLAALQDNPADVVSFTFGLPTAEQIALLRSLGTAIVLNATTPAEAAQALRLEPDALVLQGAEAGGHRAQYDQAADPADISLTHLLAAVAPTTTVPLIAAGGIASAGDVSRLLASGAAAVQVGTQFLLAHEAGTKPLHRQALESEQFTETTVTRVFSGRPARGLRNAFIDRMTTSEVVGYPEVHYLTSPLRAAAFTPDGINAWAGTGFASCRAASATEILTALTP